MKNDDGAEDSGEEDKASNRQDCLPSRQGLTKPFFKQVPLSEYEQQIREMNDAWLVSQTLPLHKIAKVKTVKQYMAMCQKILKKREAKKRKKRVGLNEDLMDVGVQELIAEEPQPDEDVVLDE